MRFPGQYFDKETNLHYNYFRDYDPSLGRYVESDPIGLRGGLNLYGYVDGSFLTFSDLSGLSYVEYDRPSNLLCLFSKQGMPLGCWPAYNNLCPGILKTKWQAGQSYTFSWLSRRASPQSVGPNGNFIFNVPGCNGCGVHSGRSSPQACTDGCIRTTDTGTSTMLQTHRNDPITHIDIK